MLSRRSVERRPWPRRRAKRAENTVMVSAIASVISLELIVVGTVWAAASGSVSRGLPGIFVDSRGDKFDPGHPRSALGGEPIGRGY